MASLGIQATSPGLPGITAGGSGESTRRPVANQPLDGSFIVPRLRNHEEKIDGIVLDEFQNIENVATQSEIIEMIKSLANEGCRIKFVLCGVAESDEALVVSERYSEFRGRHFTARRISLMEEPELQDIIRRREKLFNVRFTDEVRNAIAHTSSGFPSLVHTLALHAAYAWLARTIAVDLASRILGTLSRVVGRHGPSLKKVGIRVERSDLNIALGFFARDFEQHYPLAAQQYRELRRREDRLLEIVDTVALASGDVMHLSEICRRVEIRQRDVLELLKEASGLMTEMDGSLYKLEPLSLKSFIRAAQYAALLPPNSGALL